MHRFPPLVLAFALLAATVRADVSLPAVFTDHMVLQRDRPLAIWGTASPSEEIAVRFAEHEARTRAAHHP